MPYITIFRPPRTHQVTFDEILMGEVEIPQSAMRSGPIADTVTRFYPSVSPKLLRRVDVPSLIAKLSTFCEAHSSLFVDNKQSLYSTFYIPKRSGGLRRIDAPNEDLMNALRELKSIFESQFGALYHTSAFAYVANRSTIDCVKRHQGNESRWFLKTDFSNFFGSTTEEFLFRMISQIFPFSAAVQCVAGKTAIKKALSLCFLNGGLPQGTPISPMLTNLMMIPIDFKLANSLKQRGFIYTRYADDIIISHKYSFIFMDIVKEINGVLSEFEAPFRLNSGKTRYGSSSGSNWNLGVMLNANNEITLGWRKKKQLRAMINSFVLDSKNNIPWDYHDVAAFSGLLSYCKMVEPSFYAQLLRFTYEKYGVDLKILIQNKLNGGSEHGTEVPDSLWI